MGIGNRDAMTHRARRIGAVLIVALACAAPVVFVSADTPIVTPTSTRTFNELAASLDNTEVYCVSADLPFAQGRFCGSEGLANVKTASTFRTNFGSAFGVTLTSGVLKGTLARAVVVADEKGKVLHTELVSEIANEPNYVAAINSLR